IRPSPVPSLALACISCYNTLKSEGDFVDNIVLIGMPGSGKSTVGVLLAKTLGYGFIDTDLILQQREGALLQEILDTRGVEAFLDAECAALCGLSCTKTVIAPGGSAVCRRSAMEHLRAMGRVIYLRLPPEALGARLSNMSTRGIAMAPGETLEAVYARRCPLYEAYADAVVDCGGQTLEETVAAVLKAVV
ncbi:MAG: shikimate kinase, partial [Pseudoflavonifractor sp.]